MTPIEFGVTVRYGETTGRSSLDRLDVVVGVRVMVLPYVRGMVAVPKYLIEKKEK